MGKSTGAVCVVDVVSSDPPTAVQDRDGKSERTGVAECLVRHGAFRITGFAFLYAATALALQSSPLHAALCMVPFQASSSDCPIP